VAKPRGGNITGTGRTLPEIFPELAISPVFLHFFEEKPLMNTAAFQIRPGTTKRYCLLLQEDTKGRVIFSLETDELDAEAFFHLDMALDKQNTVIRSTCFISKRMLESMQKAADDL
jgi:hypothetical protein